MSTENRKSRIAHSGVTQTLRLTGPEVVFSRGHMGEVFDSQGRAYFDFIMGFGPVILGHAHPEFQRKLIESMQSGIMMPGYTQWHEVYLERLLSDRPNHLGAFFKTASEAVTAAFRVAATETKRLGIIRCGFIGWHDAQLANSVNWHEPLASPLRKQLHHTENMRGIGQNEPVFNWTDFNLSRLSDLLRDAGDRIGVFIFDAYLASYTDLATLREAISLCHKAGVLVVSDETKTGGRISKLGYAAQQGLDADLVVIGKCLANGAPISILTGRESLLKHCARARVGGTFSKEILSLSAALATLEVMQEQDGYAKAGQIGTRVSQVLAAASAEAGVSAWVGAKPVLGGGMFELTYAEKLLPAENLRKHLRRCFAEYGILILDGHPSFVCLGHEQMDWTALKEQSVRAFSHWAESSKAELN